MGLKELAGYVVLVELLVLGVFCAALLAGTAAAGGVVTIDMTRFGERWIEYWLMVGLVAVTPYALYLVDDVKFKTE